MAVSSTQGQENVSPLPNLIPCPFRIFGWCVTCSKHNSCSSQLKNILCHRSRSEDDWTCLLLLNNITNFHCDETDWCFAIVHIFWIARRSAGCNRFLIQSKTVSCAGKTFSFWKVNYAIEVNSKTNFIVSERCMVWWSKKFNDSFHIEWFHSRGSGCVFSSFIFCMVWNPQNQSLACW